MTEQGLLRPGWARPELVAALSQCVAEWEGVLRASALIKDQRFYGLLGRTRQLEAPSRSVGFGGVGHHLTELSRIAETSASVAAAREQLGVVRDLLASARSSLTTEELARAQASGPASLAPPPLLSGYIKADGPAGLQPRAPFPPISQAPVAAPPPATGLAPPRLLTSFGQKLAPSPPPLFSGAPPALGERPLPMSPLSPAPPQPPPGAAAARPQASPAGYAPVAAVPGRPAQPNLMVRSVLGLRAFGQKNRTPPPQGASALPPLPGSASDPPQMLGLQRLSSSASEPPQALGGGYGGLPALREPSGGNLGGPGLPDLLRHAERGSSDHRRVAQRTPAAMSSTSKRGRAKFGGAPRRRGQSGEQRWWVGALAALGVCIVVLGIVLVAVMATRRRDEPAVASNLGGSAAPGGSNGPPAPASGALPRSRLTTDDERFRSLLTQVHGRGGKESAELRSLLDEQASIAAQSLQPGCVGPQCKALAEIGQLVTSTAKKRVKRRSRSPDNLRSGWLAGLDMPEIAVEDDPRVQKRFEFYTANPLGRETFQQMLFRCGAYNDTIQSSLIRHGLPKDLIAVAYAESGCYPLAKSPAGAEGLWQFIPDAARAFHLRIIDGVVDERHSPQKSTEAAIQYFGDMYAKFGSWDLVFSAYNMGPFGLATRLEHVECGDGQSVGFWELVDAEMLPGETADYAPAIQAIALILNNLQKLKFGGVQRTPPQMTMDLQVPPNTRLSLVARAAGLSLSELRRLNLDIEGTSTPNVQSFAVQVPKDSVWQARDTLQELLKSKDESDLCAPQNFDWGRQRFTPAMQEACARNLNARTTPTPPAPDAP